MKHAFPCLSRLGDGKRGQAVVTKIVQEMESLGLSVVGWYHSHPFAPSAPTIQVQLYLSLNIQDSNLYSVIHVSGTVIQLEKLMNLDMTNLFIKKRHIFYFL